MKTATVANAKSHLSSLLTDVEAGQEIVITRRGRPIARLVPEPRDATPFDWDSVEAWVESGPPAPGATVADLRERDLL
jgi:prevent-host-death family protein